MKFVIDKPYRVLLPEGLDLERVKTFLTFRDKSISFQLAQLKRNKHLAMRWGQEYYEQRLEELKRQQNRCLLKEDGELLYTYSGLAEDLSGFFGLPAENQIQYPEPETIPWAKVPDKQMRPYQVQMVEKLLEVRHGAVSCGTGLGKSLSALHLVKRLGLPTLVVTPSVSIASQMYEMFKEAFGTKYVGMFGDGKKQFKKRIVVGIAQSLTRLEPGDEAYEVLASKSVLLADESHLLPATTFEKVFVGLGAEAPYRFSFSATQMRTDGAELLLKGLIGPIVFNMTVQDGVDQGYLARPIFKMIQVSSSSSFRSNDANKMDRIHLLENPNVVAKAASIANHAASQGKGVLILIDEFSQAALLERYLVFPREFAHGGLPTLSPRDRARQKRNPNVVRDIKDILPEKFWKSDVVDQVRRFNSGDFKILIGTSAIGLGTDILPAEVLIIMRKGTSDTKFIQSVGRGTRRIPGKDRCLVFDFDVVNIDVVHRHAKVRASIYDGIMPPVQYVDMTEKVYV